MKKLFLFVALLIASISYSQNKSDKSVTIKNTDIVASNKKNKSFDEKKPLIILDGKIISSKKLKKLDPENIKSVNILKGENATALYGSKAIDGAIIVTTKPKKELKKEKAVKLNSDQG